MDYSGLRVKDGRLINDRPVGKSGIEEAAELRKMMIKNEKISVVSQGYLQSSGRSSADISGYAES